MVGTIVSVDGTNYRVIGYHDGVFSLVDMDVDRLSLKFVTEDDLRQNLRNGTWVAVQETPLVVDFGLLTEKEQQKVALRKELLKEIVSAYGPMFDALSGKKAKPLIQEATAKYGMSRPTVWKLIRTYLQSGMNDAVLVNKNSISAGKKRAPYSYSKRPGRRNEFGTQSIVLKDEVLIHRFDEAIAEYKKGRERSLADSYSWLIDKYYSETLPTGELQKCPISERPTIKQFYDYVRKKISKEEKDRLKTSFAEQRNNHRLLLSSSRIDAVGPGRIMEIDAWEGDVQIISEVNGDLVGKPIVYLGIDVYSSVISAMSVSLENNSMIGMTNVLLNLSDDKHRLAAGYNFSFDDGLWPSNYLPQELRCDRGMDFQSNQLEDVCRKVGIIRTLVTGASGSLKGIVEQAFHQFKRSVSPALESKGLITYRYDDDGKKTACMKLRDFTRMALTFVVSHNSKPIQEYPMDTKMIREGLIPAPCELWKYGCKERGAPTPITCATYSQFLFNIMPECNAKISRHGVSKDGLWYRNEDHDLMAHMYSLGNKHGNFTVHFDPRDVSHLYYLKNGHVEMLHLNSEIPGQEDFIGMTWKECEDYMKAKKELLKAGEEVTLEVRDFRRKVYEQIVSRCDSSPQHIPNNTEMRKNRAFEKQRTNYDNRIATRMEHAQIYETIDTPLPKPDGQEDQVVYELLAADEASTLMMELV